MLIPCSRGDKSHEVFAFEEDGVNSTMAIINCEHSLREINFTQTYLLYGRQYQLNLRLPSVDREHDEDIFVG